MDLKDAGFNYVSMKTNGIESVHSYVELLVS